MSGSAAFEDIGYRVDDGDMGYAGDTHQSFRPRALPRIGGRPSEMGSAVCRQLLHALRARFPQCAQPAAPGAIAPNAYQAAVAYVTQGRG